MRRFFRSAAFPILIVIVLAFFAQRLLNGDEKEKTPTLSEFQAQVQERSRRVRRGHLPAEEQHDPGPAEERQRVLGRLSRTTTSRQLVRILERHDVAFNAEGTGGSSFLSILTYILPFILFFGFWLFLMNQMQGGGSRVMSFGKSRAKRMSVDAPKITFRDVAGVDEAVQELHEIKEFLENPKRFQALGARIPKGVLLYGPPGTGKTLLARAVAGEAGVPFFSISGSDFVEMFVGVGASRVRDLFEQAKQNSPCIIFMDEIDAVGRHRGAGMGGGHDEREQTLNQLLVEMDGFEMKDNIILIAATNRPDILDPALLRPGRFDRQIVVDRPDRKGRKQILEVHTRGKPLAKVIDLDALAGQTPGFTGADLANLINEAALLTARSSKREITMDELEEGIMRVIAGPEKKSRVMSEKERLVTAYHELGHAIVGHLLPNCDPVHKISIISRGQALGYTISLPTEDKFLTTRAELTDTMGMTLGGRAAEEIVFGEITTGASNDLEKVTATAKQMVMRYGMSERLGPRVFGHDRSQPFLGREFSSEPDYSDEIAREIDDEIRRIVEEAHQTAKDILIEHREAMDRISRILLRARDDQLRGVREAARGGLRGRGVRRARGGAEGPRGPRGAGEESRSRGPQARAAAASRFRRQRRDARRPPRRLATFAEPPIRPRSARYSPGDPDHGDRQRDPRLVLGRGPVPANPSGRSSTAARLLDEGADLLDVGGESTRPGARGVSAAEELARVGPVVEELRGAPARRSRSTPPRSRSRRPRSTPARGSSTTSRRFESEPELAALCADRDCGLVLMHMQGTPRTMQSDPTYDDVVDDVKAFLAERIEFATAEGVARGAHLDRPWDRLRQDRRSQPGAPAAAQRAGRARPADRGRHLPQELPRQPHGPRGRRAGRRHDRLQRAGDAGRSVRVPGPRRGRSIARRSTSPRRSSAVVPGRAGSRSLPDSGAGALVASRPVEAHRPGLELLRRGRDPPPLDLHASRRQRGRARDRAAPRDRRQLRRPGLRRRC